VTLSHMTEADPDLTHQVRFIAGNPGIFVSCNCRRRAAETENFYDGSRSFDPMGLSRNLDESRKLYNDPKNHWAPFTDKDKAKW
jgi:hypothetical protein